MTAVEFLFDAVYKDMSYPELLGLIAQAKIIEKQQQGYSDEEVLEIIKKLYVEIGFQFTNEIKEWCSKQFKNK